MIRRQFLRWALGSLSTALAANVRSTPTVPRDDLPNCTHEIACWFADPDAAAGIGASYLASHPHSAGIEHWLQRAGVDPDRTDSAAVADFKNRRQADFLAGRTELVNGWVLARTELAGCVVLALVHGHRR